MRYSFALIFACSILSLFVAPAYSQGTRGIGARTITLDDSLGHSITLQTPQPGDSGYAAWIAQGGTSVWKLPIPPFPDANAGFVLPGDTSGQLLIWVPAPAGGPQGAWEPIDADEVPGLGGGGGGGGISGSGTNGTIPIWTGSTSLGNSNLTDNGTTLSYSQPNINSGATFQIGDTTVLTAPGTENIFVGGYAGASNGSGSSNTALGNTADFGSGPLTNATSIGANSYVTQSNSLVLGSISGTNGASNSTSVGIGTTAPQATLDIQAPNSDAIHVTSEYGEDGSYDILGDSWNVNDYGQLLAGGTDQPDNNSVVTLDNGHLGAINNNGLGWNVTPNDSEGYPDVTFNYYTCGSNDVAGAVDFNINQTQEGNYVEIDFNEYYSTPIVTITPANEASAAYLNSFYVQTDPFGSYFRIVEDQLPPGETEYQFYYHVINIQCSQEPSKTQTKHTPR